MFPYSISFRDIPESDAVHDAIVDRVEKLETFFDQIVRCEVTISCPHRHRHTGQLYHIMVHAFLPGKDVVINHNSNEAHRDIYVAIRDTFDAAERVLEDRVRLLRNETKVHESNYEQGVIYKVFADRGYGFVLSDSNREVYFNEGSILNAPFERVKVGEKVRFVEELGEKGPQATSLTLIR